MNIDFVSPHAARRALTGLATISAIAAISGCGNDRESSSNVPRVTTGQTTPTLTGPTAAPPATTAPSTTTTATPSDTTTTGTRPQPSASSTSKAKSRSKSAAASEQISGKGKSKPPATTGKTTPSKPTAGSIAPIAPNAPTDTEPDPPGPNPPLDCLKKAGLKDAVKRNNNIWGAMAGDNLVLVDGPYGSAQAAKDSAATLKEVSRAQPGGAYVVSAALRAEVGSEVAAVATCLDKA